MYDYFPEYLIRGKIFIAKGLRELRGRKGGRAEGRKGGGEDNSVGQVSWLIGLFYNAYFGKMNVKIRKAVARDMEVIHKLVCELADYEHGLHRVTTTPESYRKDFEEKVFDAFVAEVDGDILGMALYYMNFSTWRGKMMYLEDFIVKESMRGHGIGAKLFEAFLDEAKKQGCIMVKWQVLRWNEPAIHFYKKYDVVLDDEWVDGKIYFE